jgi:hypothetical protein
VFLLLAPAARPAEDTRPPAFTVRSAGGKSLMGPLKELAADWSVTVGSSRVAGADLLTLRRAGPLPPMPADEHLILNNGDRVPFKTLRLEGEKLLFRNGVLNDGKDVAIPLGAVSLIWLTAPASVDTAERFRREVLAGPRKRDVVVLRNGDRLEGILNKVEPDRLEVEVDRKPVSVKMPQVAVVALSTELADRTRPKGIQGRLVLGGTDATAGARLTLSEAACRDGETLTGKTAWGAALKVPLTRVAALDLAGGRALYLSELEPKTYEFTPFLGSDGPRWPLGRDATADGHDLRLGGSVCDKGLGLHAQARVTYELPAGCTRFEARVGLDDRRGRRGSARIAVLVDGKAVKLERDELTASRGLVSLSIPLAGAKTLTLAVDFGARGDVQAVVDWADARLVLESPRR